MLTQVPFTRPVGTEELAKNENDLVAQQTEELLNAVLQKLVELHEVPTSAANDVNGANL